MKYRKAEMGDLPGLLEIYPLLFEASAALQPHRFQKAQQDEAFLRGTILGDDSDILVAEDGGRIVGFALLLQMETPPYKCVVRHGYAYLMDLLVIPGYRRRGVGGELLSRAVLWAKDKGLDFVELNVLAQNEDAIRFYKKHGFFDTMKTMQHMV